MKKEYTHILNDSIESISGHYTFFEERHLNYNSKDVLYLLGTASHDSSCCGIGGCLFAHVIGFVSGWHYKRDKRGLPVSSIETISDNIIQTEISQLIKADGMVSQVNYR